MTPSPQANGPAANDPGPPITVLLDAARDGDRDSANAVYEAVYGTLRAMAGKVFARDAGRTLAPTVLIHEAWMKLAGSESGYRNRHHFLAVACRSMRQVLQDHVRSRGRQKRAGNRERVTLGDAAQEGEVGVDLLDLHEALEELEKLNERHARVVSMRALAGMTVAEVAEVLEVSRGTIESDWRMGRAWLRDRLGRADPAD